MFPEPDDIRLSHKIHLPSGQDRLKEAILYVAQKCADARFFGKVKLNKILWRADFEAFARRGVPVTGRQYQRLKLGPAPVEMPPILNELLQKGLLKFEHRMQGNWEEQRAIALADPNLSTFSKNDLTYLDEAISYYWDYTGTETSDQSHGVAWSTRTDGDPMPYELSYLSDEPLTNEQREGLAKLAAKFGWKST